MVVGHFISLIYVFLVVGFHVNNSNFKIRAPNLTSQLSQGFLTSPVSNDSVLAEKRRYRRESFLRWKNKRRKTNSHCALSGTSAPFPVTNNSVLAEKRKYRREAFLRWKNKRRKTHSGFALRETSAPFTITDISEQPGPSNLSAFVVSETTDGLRTGAKRCKPRSQGHTPTMGRGLLSFIPTMAAILPRMQDCPHCGAVKFYSETNNFCCLNGRVVLTSNELPGILKDMKKLLLLSLWNQFDEKEGNNLAGMIGSGVMIFGMRLKVTTFNCLSLSTRGTSCFMINPPVARDLQMHEWYNENKTELQQLLEMKSYKNSDILLPYPKDEDIIPIATVVASFRTIRMTIQIDDGTATLSATICTPDVEKIVPYTAVELKEADEHSIDFHDDIVKSVQQHTIVAFIRSYEATFRGQTDMKVSVVKAYTLDEQLSPPKLIVHKPEKLDSGSTSNVADTSTANLPANQASETTQAGSMVKPSADKGIQLFSPTTKLVLEEINSTIGSKAAKRSLPFSNKELDGETVAHVLAIKKEVGDQDMKGTDESSGNVGRMYM
ncbi:replication protein A 70 kDa DNA-binding subunit B-like protein [Tanacetum coccineum]